MKFWSMPSSGNSYKVRRLLARGHALLQVMENRLAGHGWLMGNAAFPGIGRWLERIAALPGYKGLEA